MKDALSKLREFHALFEIPTAEKPQLPSLTAAGSEYMFDITDVLDCIEQQEVETDDLRVLRVRLLCEEVGELVFAESRNDLIKIADALGDIIYIAVGTALVYGIPLDRVFDEIHASNMRKVFDGEVQRRDDGKVLKPQGWRGPDIARALFESTEGEK